MRVSERRMSLEASMPMSAVQTWLCQELELRGIDAMVYTRYILSILQQDNLDLELSAEKDPFSKAPLSLLRGKQRGKRTERSRLFNGEELKKTAAVECLLSATDEDQGIIGLVEETYRKLKEQEYKGSKNYSAVKAGGSGNSATGSKPEAACSDRTSSPKSVAEGYYEAFPALSDGNLGLTKLQGPSEASVWSKRQSPVFEQADKIHGGKEVELHGSFGDEHRRPLRTKRQAPRPYVYYKIGKDVRTPRRDGKRRTSFTGLRKHTSPTKPRHCEEGMKITEDILNLLKVHPENVQIRHPTIRRVSIPSTDADSEEKYLYTGPLDAIFPPKSQNQQRLYERVNVNEMFASSEVLELISHDTDSVSRFLPFFVTKKKPRDLFASDVEEARSLADLMNKSNNNNLSPCATGIRTITAALTREVSQSSSESDYSESPDLILADEAWLQEVLGRATENKEIGTCGGELAEVGDQSSLAGVSAEEAKDVKNTIWNSGNEDVWCPNSENLHPKAEETEDIKDKIWNSGKEDIWRPSSGKVSSKFKFAAESWSPKDLYGLVGMMEELKGITASEKLTTESVFAGLVRDSPICGDVELRVRANELGESSSCPSLKKGVDISGADDVLSEHVNQERCASASVTEAGHYPSSVVINPAYDVTVVSSQMSVPCLGEPAAPFCTVQPRPSLPDLANVADVEEAAATNKDRSDQSPIALEIDRMSSPFGLDRKTPTENVKSTCSSEVNESEIKTEHIAATADSLSLSLSIDSAVVNENSGPSTVDGASNKGIIISEWSPFISTQSDIERDKGLEVNVVTASSLVDVGQRHCAPIVTSCNKQLTTQYLNTEEESSDSDSDSCTSPVCGVCHGVVCLCSDTPIAPTLLVGDVLRHDVTNALRHSEGIRLRSVDSVTSEHATPYVSMMDLMDNDLVTSLEDERYVIDERTRTRFESHESSSLSTSDSESGADYILLHDDEILQDLDTVLAELNVPQESLAYEECDDVFSHQSFDDASMDALDLGTWDAVGAPAPYAERANVSADTGAELDSASESVTEGEVDQSPHDLLWLFDLCNLHNFYAELGSVDDLRTVDDKTYESEHSMPDMLLRAKAYIQLGTEMESLLHETDSGLADTLQALGQENEYPHILGHLNKLLQTQLKSDDDFNDVRWYYSEGKHIRRSSCSDIQSGVKWPIHTSASYSQLAELYRAPPFQPSDASAFRDKIPPRLLRELPHSYSDSSIFMKIAPVIKVHARSEDDAVESDELFSPETHFRPILSTPDDSKRTCDLLTKPDIFNHVYPSDMTHEYQVYNNPEVETNFVPKFRLAKFRSQDKGLQTDLNERIRRRAYTEACIFTCRELLASYSNKDTAGLSKVLPLSELCSRVVYRRNAALMYRGDRGDSSSGESAVNYVDVDLDGLFSTSLSLKDASDAVQETATLGADSVLTSSSTAFNNAPERWQHWSRGGESNIWADPNGVNDVTSSISVDAWAYLAPKDVHREAPAEYPCDYSATAAMDESICKSELPRCPPGDEAPFSSELEEQWLLQGLDQSLDQILDWKPRKRTRSGSLSNRPCTFFMEGSCRRTDCRFSHDLSHITCRFWLKGECFKGVTCPFLHGYLKINESPTQKLSPVDFLSQTPSPSSTTAPSTADQQKQVFPPCLKDQDDFPPISACHSHNPPPSSTSCSHRKLTFNQKRKSKSRSSSKEDF